MSATATEPRPHPPLPLTPELLAGVARRRADGRSWAKIGAVLHFDAEALRCACAADERFAPALAVAEDEAVREGEAVARRRLSHLTASDNDRVALRAAELLIRHAREYRRKHAESETKVVEVPKAVEAKTSPRVPDRVPLPNPKPAGAFRAIPDLPAARLAELVKGGQ